MNIYCVVGVPGSGKSWYSEKLAEWIKQMQGQAVLLQPGKIFRSTFGAADLGKWIKLNSDNLALTESMVRSLVRETLWISHTIGSDVIIDGFLRSIEQVSWLINELRERAYNHVTVTIIAVYATEGKIEERLRKRDGDDPAKIALNNVRQSQESHRFSQVRDFLLHKLQIDWWDWQEQKNLAGWFHMMQGKPFDVKMKFMEVCSDEFKNPG